MGKRVSSPPPNPNRGSEIGKAMNAAPPANRPPPPPPPPAPKR